MTLYKTVNILGYYMKKAITVCFTFIRPDGLVKTRRVWLLSAAAIILTTFNANELGAQEIDIKGDTIFANGIFGTKDIVSDNYVPLVSLYLTPYSMEMTIPDSTYYFRTINGGAIYNNLPVFIDNSVSINQHIANECRVFPNIGSEMNIEFTIPVKGKIEFYNLTGQIISKFNFESDKLYLALNNMDAGVYVYYIQTNDGTVFTGKFIKNNEQLKGPSSSSNTNFSFKQEVQYEATYWAKWEKEYYFTDSILCTLHEGTNACIDFYMQSRIARGNGMLMLRDTSGNFLQNVDIFIRPDSIEMVTWDTVYTYVTDDMGDIVYDLPVHIDTTNINKKTPLDYAAKYWVKWVPEQGPFSGYYTDSVLLLINEGENGFTPLYATAVPGLPNNLDLEGYVWKLENTSSTLENAQVKVTVNSTGDEYTAISDANGHFLIEDLPLGEDITFDIGGISDRYSFAGIDFTTPSEIINPADSINNNFSAVLPLKRATTTADHIRDQTRNGTEQQIIYFYLGNTLTSNEKNTMRNYFLTLESDEGGVYDFEESLTPLENTGINIEYGTYNTQAYNDEIQTPLGQILYPVTYANTTMGTSSGYSGFGHEIKRALGFDEVGWYSVMRADAPDYTLEDKEIAQFFERPYWNALYQEGKTWIDLNKIVEDLNSKSPNSNISNTKIDNY